MQSIPKVRLSEFFRLFEPTHVLGTTYTLSLAFFESVIFPSIRKEHLQTCLLICDQLGFRRAVTEAVALRGAAQQYAVIAAPVEGRFHPKVWLMLNGERVALLSGSGNLTQSGFMENIELFDTLQVRKGDSSGLTASQDIIKFLDGLMSLWVGTQEGSVFAVDALRQMRNCVKEISRGIGDESDTAQFISSFAGSIVSQLPQTPISGSLYIASPYFGGSARAVSLLQRKYKPTLTKIFPAIHEKNSIDVPLEQLHDLPGTSAHFMDCDGAGAHFRHLKLYGLAGTDGKGWLFCGSANCTEAALKGPNVEAGILRQIAVNKLQEYFTESLDPLVDIKVRDQNNESEYKEDWIAFWAVDAGSMIEITVPPSWSDRLPFLEVTLTLRVGSSRSEIARNTIFHGGRTESVAWEHFAQAKRQNGASPLIELLGKDSHGQKVAGAAFVDDVVTLASSPLHRSAFRGAVALLSGEGMPDYSDIAAIFTLTGDIFEPVETEEQDEVQIHTTDQEGKHVKKAEAEKVGLWPPQAIKDETYRFHDEIGQGRLHWCQRILERFLKIDHSTASSADGSSGPADEDDEGQEGSLEIKEPDKKIVSACAYLWRQACAANESLKRKLQRLVPNGRNATNVHALSVFVFLATLAIRRAVARKAPDSLELPSLESLLHDFLDLLFGYRPQSDGYCVPQECRYKYNVFPPLALDLKNTFGLQPHQDLCAVFLSTFAFLKASDMKFKSNNFSPIAWFSFRFIARDYLKNLDAEVEHIKALYHAYMVDSKAGLTWENVASALASLKEIKKKQHPGLRDIIILESASAESIIENEEQLSSYLHPDLHKYFSWKHKSNRRFFSVFPFQSACNASGCSKIGVIDPEKQRLAKMLPVICKSCGALLVPDFWLSIAKDK